MSETGRYLDDDQRFWVVRKISDGASGTVWEAHDRIFDVRRAIKVANSKSGWRQLRREFLLLSKLRHPYIVRPYDLGRAGGKAFFTMDLVEGAPIHDFATFGDINVICGLMLQVLEALGVIHARGLVHRDIQPRNILVSGQAQHPLVRLVDFGLARDIGEVAPAAGTLPYIAPEVQRGEGVDGRADLFSLGVVVYEMLVGENFAANPASLTGRFAGNLPPLSEAQPRVPPTLSAWVGKLLAQNPSDRFDNAEQAATELLSLASVQIGRPSTRAIAERLLRGGAESQHVRALREALTALTTLQTTARGKTLWVSAEQGVGKSPWLRDLAVRSAALGLRTLHIRLSKAAESPLAALLRIAGSSHMPSGSDLYADATRLARDVSAQLRNAPTVLLFDDTHLAEPLAVETLRALAELTRSRPLVLVFVAETGASPAFEALSQHAQHLELKPIKQSHIARLASERLRGLQLPRPAIERIRTDSGGLPSLVERTLAHLLAENTIVQEGQSFTFVGGRYAPVRHGDADSVDTRLLEIPLSTRKILWSAAVLARDIRADTLADVAMIDLAQATQGLWELCQAQILEPTEATADPTYKFTSHSLAASAYQGIPAHERRLLHDQAAKLERPSGKGAGRIEERVEHLLRGSDDDLAVSAAMAAAERAAATYSDRRAIEYYARGYARLRSDSDLRAIEIALRLGALFERQSELERASTWYLAAERACAGGYPTLAIRALLGQGTVAIARGTLDLAQKKIVSCRKVLDTLTSGSPRLWARVESLEAQVLTRKGLLAGALDHLRLAQDYLQGIKDVESVHVQLALVRLLRDQGQTEAAIAAGHEALAQSRALGDQGLVAEAYLVLTRALALAGRLDEGLTTVMQAIRLAFTHGDRLREAWAQRELGVILLRQGDFEGALARLSKALELSRAVRAHNEECATLVVLGSIRARLGQLKPAVATLASAWDMAHQAGDVPNMLRAGLELARCHVWLGDPVAAESALDLLRALPSGVEIELLRQWAAWVRGDFDFAGLEEHVSLWKGQIDALPTPYRRGQAMADLCMVLHKAGKQALARERAGELLSLCEQGQLHDFSALGLMVLGANAPTFKEASAQLKQATLNASQSGQLLIEVESRWQLGMVDTSQTIAEYTQAMELLRKATNSLPQEQHTAFLIPYVPLRNAFRTCADKVWGQGR